MTDKQCSKCRVTKTTDDFGTDRNRKNGLHIYCRQCVRKNSAIFRVNNPIKARESSAKYRRENPEKRKQSVRKYCDENKERIAQSSAQYRKDHPEKRTTSIARYNADNRLAVRARNAKWALENPGSTTAKSARHRASKLQAMPPWSNGQYVNDLYENCREAELIFADAGVDIKFHVDHIVPLQHDKVCGLHVADNLQILTETENCVKSNQFIVGYQ